MYSLPDDFNEQLLEDCYLEVVQFGCATTNFVFSRAQKNLGESHEFTFSVEGGLSFSNGGEVQSRNFSDPSSCAPLIGFLMKDVAYVKRIGLASLQIHFSENEYLFINGDDNKGFESYTIYLPSADLGGIGDIIVV